MAGMKHGPACAALALAALLAYSNSFQAGLVMDNRAIIAENPRLREPMGAAVRQIATTEYWWPYAGQGLYRPLTIFSYWCNYQLSELRVFGYHVVNFLLHAGNAMLVHALALALAATPPAAFLAGALFALHPIATESVTNIVGRADLLATLGVLGALLAHIRSQSATGRQRVAWLAAMMLAAGIGFFSKESALVLPAVLLLHDFAFGKRRWSNYWVLVPPLLLWVAARQVLFTQVPALPVSPLDNSLLNGDAWTARLTAVAILGRYLWLLVWPAHLSADYSYDQIPLVRGVEAGFLMAAAVIVAALVAAAWLWRRQPVASFCILFFFVALAPVSNLFVFCGSTMAERFLYLPMAGAAVMAGLLCDRAGGVGRAGCGVLLLAGAVRTYVRNEDWRDDLIFWTRLVQTSPRSHRAHAGLAAELLRHPEHTDAAVVSIGRALEIAPDSLLGQLTAGRIYRAKGDALARRDETGDLQQTPASAQWYQRSLAALERAASLAAAERASLRDWETRRAGQGIRNVAEAAILDEMGQTWLRIGNPGAAIEVFGRAIAADPANESARDHLRYAQEMMDESGAVESR